MGKRGCGGRKVRFIFHVDWGPFHPQNECETTTAKGFDFGPEHQAEKMDTSTASHQDDQREFNCARWLVHK